jgi:threonine/homoserine/homoserine lactone efflux protein
MTTCKSMSAIFMSSTNPKVIAYVSTVLGTIINLMFLPSTVTMVVIILHSKVSSTYIST